MIKSALSEGRRVRHLPIVQQHAVGSVFLLAVLLLIGTLLYSTLSWMWDDQRLPLSKIVLQGDMEYVTTRDVQQSFARLDHIGTFMSQDIESLQETVQSIPWVSQVSIRKQWPDTIKVFLTEHQAEAIWNGDTLLNAKGNVFNGDIGQLRGDRVKLYGPIDSSQHVLAIWREISPLFQALDLNIRSLVLNDRRAWQIILDNGMRLELGKESLDERIARFISLYKNLGNDAERVSYIDLRYDTGAAVGWFPEPGLEQESTDD
ncbi:cell division protein FtsQ/DivIB [Vibrio lamellibrachiae]|uniref:cell division protein FtsQ/DivIB n=1 Tax=Vibrio lamellibrachiae TaxID=2910253 RepID=UPI003D150FBD